MVQNDVVKVEDDDVPPAFKQQQRSAHQRPLRQVKPKGCCISHLSTVCRVLLLLWHIPEIEAMKADLKLRPDKLSKLFAANRKDGSKRLVSIHHPAKAL